MLNNLLIVDDEYYTVEIIKNQYRWEELGIGQVFIAYSVTQAMSLVETQHIDVAICDIEMGSQNGLDLLAWLQKNHPYVVSFILSGHSQFEYCQKAIEFGSLNYVLKPIEYDQLRKVILTAVKKAEEQRARSLYIRQSSPSFGTMSSVGQSPPSVQLSSRRRLKLASPSTQTADTCC